MSTCQLPPIIQWRNLLGIFATVAEEQGPRLESEASWFGLTVDDAVLTLNRLDPELALKVLFEEEGPEFDPRGVEYPDGLDREQQYAVAVALLYLAN